MKLTNPYWKSRFVKSFIFSKKNYEVATRAALLVDGAVSECSGTASVNMNVLPLAVTFLPNTRLFGLM